MADQDAYWVTPGRDSPQRHDRTLKGLSAAMSEAKFWSRTGPAQEVTVDHLGVTKRLFEYRDGRETFRSCAGMIPAAVPAGRKTALPVDGAEVVNLAARRSRPRRRRERAVWPGLDINDPPCAGTN